MEDFGDCIEMAREVALSSLGDTATTLTTSELR